MNDLTQLRLAVRIGVHGRARVGAWGSVGHGTGDLFHDCPAAQPAPSHADDDLEHHEQHGDDRNQHYEDDLPNLFRAQQVETKEALLQAFPMMIRGIRPCLRSGSYRRTKEMVGGRGG